MDDRVLRAAHDFSTRWVEPWCRAWARRLGDRPADPIYETMCAFVFWQAHYYWPSFRNPRTFSEKLWHRGLYDRDPRWTLLSDKLRSREYIAERLGPEALVPILWSGTDPQAIPFDELPARCVLKASHGCAWNLIIDDIRTVDRNAVRERAAGWLRTNYCESTLVGMEWGYKHVPPALLVETFLGSSEHPPPDIKFYCYGGRARFTQINERIPRGHRISFFDREFRRMPFRLITGAYDDAAEVARPDNLDALMHAAERLAAGLSFIRVDLYSIDGHIYVGELTCYPAGGIVRFEPREFDDQFGEDWIVSAP
jgi:hypothetical protein